MFHDGPGLGRNAALEDCNFRRGRIGSCCKLGVLVVGVLLIGVLLFGIYVGVPDYGQLPMMGSPLLNHVKTRVSHWVSETMCCRMLMFRWSLGALNLTTDPGNKQQQHSCRRGGANKS